jgi:hypothetical protein
MLTSPANFKKPLPPPEILGQQVGLLITLTTKFSKDSPAISEPVVVDLGI